MRVRIGAARNRKKKRLFNEVKGNYGGRSKLLRTAKETLLRARAFSFRDRRAKKREIRALWITRITAAVRSRGMNYSVFMNGLKLASVELDRRALSDLAALHPTVFDEVFAVAKSAVEKKQAA
ncbi:MAG: 50S ribosomal protein L20 [Planctomycetota bacterium]|nr:50S ribosomal protein L20 [Planctomycetaceae bacterium]MDQ3330006.1 50S ribosomal protein L20 [Planctomycetota bacterium]